MQVAFSEDGAQVMSSSYDDTVRFWDVPSGREVRQLAGQHFALVEGPADALKRGRHVLIASGETLLIYRVAGGQQHAEDGVGASPVACFKAPGHIDSVRCHGATIYVGCSEGPLCILSAPFLTVL